VPTAVLSPHLDDAVLDAFTVLAAAGDVAVVNVFDAPPPPGTAPYSMRLCGATDGAAEMERRQREDAAALATVGRAAVGLGLEDDDWRGRPLEAVTIAAAAEPLVSDAGRIVAPVGIGSHPDHQLVRDAVLELGRRTGARIELCADLPYAIAWGWPPWVSGEAPDPNLDPQAFWQKALDRLPTAPGEPIVERLPDDLLARKRAAVELYESQLSMLAGGPHRRLDDWALRYEVRWPVT
jgi:LmbE family N-acetylglucosaminyl deacetylase